MKKITAILVFMIAMVSLIGDSTFADTEDRYDLKGYVSINNTSVNRVNIMVSLYFDGLKISSTFVDKQGYYEFKNLLPGRYVMKLQHDIGFNAKSFSVDNIKYDFEAESRNISSVILEIDKSDVGVNFEFDEFGVHNTLINTLTNTLITISVISLGFIIFVWMMIHDYV